MNGTTAPDRREALTLLARWGYAARGVVYLLVGGLAALAALGQGGETTDSRGALERLMTAPWGGVLLGAISVGLVGYAVWRCTQAVKDTDRHGTDAQGLAIRAGLLVSAGTHLLLAFFAASLIFTLGGGSGDSGSGSESLAGWLMQQPYGRWLVGAVGLAIIGAGIAHGIKGWKMKFHRHFDMPSRTQRWAYPVCRFGLVVRGLVFLLIGAFFILAAYEVDPGEAGGLTDVFSTLRSQAFGRWLLAFVALGLFSFGLYSLLEAVYRRVNTPG
ncbi:DUF1206 domain-containing protein [Halomonas sp. MCCC 1A17488]|uniref:DUF1206 domain-containing protein n=1 Tax=unclassified Halomonas TaxID=2609666 RepID=UPI0018D212DF|nr:MULTISPECIES: DUF1206 domain-containing protein [unclassified Halomonas]MCE8015591.1 DUF1206 domain-containing protein [Halomonas sp. MCCC 1A17488]MCG3238924.1 DUF1206 domain-containing protein [Halomonas sp. MCCC 1A17488]QPP51122.1 DUF1206 domain-containing protein [Halomonas sp. SS10-MC5]